LGCDTSASYRYPAKLKSHCAKHKKPGQITSANKKCDECGDAAEYGNATDNVLRKCEEHATNSMYKLAIQICIQCQRLDPLNMQSLCFLCAEGKTTRMLKQTKVKEFFDANKISYKSYDTTVDNGECNKLRPDFVIDCNTHCIVVEVDEFQHKRSNYDCEYPRMINIYSALGMDTVFIRYNPDTYKCGSSKMKTDATRLNTLLQTVNHMKEFENLQGMHLSVIHLFYDGNEQVLQKVDHSYFE
jgi:hypothetical protein